MTRDDAKAFYAANGVENPTKEQIDSLMNTVGSELNKAKENALKTKEIVSALTEENAKMKAELEATKNASLTDAEKVQKEIDDLKKAVAEKEAIIKKSHIDSELARVGITGDYATKFFKEDGNIDFDNLASYVANARDEAAKAKEIEIANASGKPEGNGAPPAKELSNQEKVANGYLARRVGADVGKQLANFR